HRPRGALLLTKQLTEPRARTVQPRFERALLQPRHFHHIGERIALDVVHRKKRALVLVEAPPRAIELARPQRRLRLLGGPGAVRGESGGVVYLHRIDARAIETPQLIDEEPAHHAQEPAMRLVELLELVEPRVGSHAHFLDETLGVVDGPREPISRPV